MKNSKKNCIRVTIIFSLLFIFTTISKAQFRINPYASYAFNCHIDTYDYSGTLKGGLLWGAGLEYNLASVYGAELLYKHMGSDAPMTYYDQPISSWSRYNTYNYNLNYIMFGANRYLSINRFELYSGLLIGMAIFNVNDQILDINDGFTKFAWGGRLGSNIALGPKVKIKLQAELLSAIQSLSAGLNLNLNGISPNVNTNSSMFQFNIGGGLVLQIP